MFTTTTPETVDMSAEHLQSVAAAMQAFVDQGKYAGLTSLIARRGQVVHAQAYGFLDLGTRQPLQLDSLMRIYSLTKPITTVAVLMLYEEGRFDLHDPIARWFPELKDLQVLLQRPNGNNELVASSVR